MSKPKSSASGRGKPRRRFPSSAGFKAIPRAERGAPAFGLMGQRLRDNTGMAQTPPAGAQRQFGGAKTAKGKPAIMEYFTKFQSPIGAMILTGDG